MTIRRSTIRKTRQGDLQSSRISQLICDFEAAPRATGQAHAIKRSARVIENSASRTRSYQIRIGSILHWR